MIGAVRAVHPDFLFVAEAYWDLEWRPPAARLRPLLRQAPLRPARSTRARPRSAATSTPTSTTSAGLVRFIENHDEPRAAAELAPAAGAGRRGRRRHAARRHAVARGPVRGLAGAAAGVPRPPARSSRSTSDLRAFHLRLIAAAAPGAARATGRCATASGWPDDQSCEQLLTWCWTDDGRATARRRQPRRRAGRGAAVHLPWADLAGPTWRLDDLLSGDEFERDGDEIAGEGLYVQLPPWGFHVLDVGRAAGG